MNDNWNQEDYDGMMWQETPYVSNYTSEADQSLLLSKVATKSMTVVFLGLIITTLASYLTLSNTRFLAKLFLDGLFGAFLVAEIVIVLINGWAIKKDNLVLAAVLYLAYSISNGITLSVVFLAYDLGTVKEAFLVAAIVFGVMSAYGYFTKNDLSGLGAMCSMALLGVLLVSLVNLFILHSSGLDLVMDYVVVLLFVGITAFDMYRMKQMTLLGGEAEINRIALFTGMQLYLDFINLFLRLVSIMGRKK